MVQFSACGCVVYTVLSWQVETARFLNTMNIDNIHWLIGLHIPSVLSPDGVLWFANVLFAAIIFYTFRCPVEKNHPGAILTACVFWCSGDVVDNLGY